MNGYQTRHASEMRFSVGWFDEAYLNTCPILIVRRAGWPYRCLREHHRGLSRQMTWQSI